MSDIGLPKGMAAFLVAGGLGVVFLLATLLCLSILAPNAGRRNVPLVRHRAFPHLRGLLFCLLGYGGVLLFLLATDGEWSLRAVNEWLDNAIPFWAGGILALWPLSVLAARRRISD